MTEARTLRDTSGLARWARMLVLLNAAVMVPTAALSLLPVGEDLTLIYLITIAALAQFITYVAAAVVSLRWLYFANANARALGATDLMGSPALVLVWFFIPIVNLFLPYLSVRDTWRASVRPRDWQAVRAPVQFHAWWGCWLVAGLISSVVFWSEYRSGFQLEREPMLAQLDLASALVWAVAAWFFAWIIAAIQAAQADPAHLHEHFS